MGLRGEDMLSECFARSADVATANAVVRIIPSPPLIPSSEGTFCHVRCSLRVETAGCVQIIRLQPVGKCGLSGWREYE